MTTDTAPVRRPRLRRTRRAALALVLLLTALVVVGSLRDTHVVTVSRTTTADRDVLWDLWADVDARPEWDEGLEYIRLDGPFAAGSRGEVKVEGQDPVGYTVVSVDPGRAYTDRFESLPATHTDWHHEISRDDEGRTVVTWRLEARGPFSLVSWPVLRGIFGSEVPTAVERYVDLAEERSGR